MVKRTWSSPLARRESVGLRSRLSAVNIPRNLLEAREIVQTDGKLSDEKIKAFVLRHRGEVSRYMTEYAREIGEDAVVRPRNIRSALASSDLPMGELRSVAVDIAENVGRSAATVLGKEMRRNGEKYFKKRFPSFDRALFGIAFEDLIRNSSLKSILSGSIDLAKLERNYVRLAKEKRRVLQEYSKRNNLFIEGALRDLRLSHKKIGVARRWIERNHERFGKMFEERLLHALSSSGVREGEFRIKGGTVKKGFMFGSDFLKQLHQISDEVAAMEKKELREFVLSTLSEKRGVFVQRPVSGNGSAKVGLRDERKRVYEESRAGAVNVEAQEARQNAERLESAKSAARTIGSKFDQVGYCLREIARASPALDEQLRGLLRRGVIKPNAVVQLYNNGSLAQRVFFRSLTEFGFEQKYGSEKIESLARMISVIGPRVPRIDNVKKSVPPKDSAAVYDFLVRTGLANPSHRGGACIALARAKF